MNRPLRPHQIVNADGTPREYRRMTDIICPICNPASGGARLGVVAELQGTITLECEHCGHSQFASATEAK